MNSESSIDYGPLETLIGTWKGDRGIDVSPEPDGTERSPYYETIEFQAADDVENAEQQTLSIVRYHQRVFRKSNDEQFHDQLGYFTWEADTGRIVHSFVIPRGVAIVAGGTVSSSDGSTTKFELSAADGDPDWSISQSPFMRDNARTAAFSQSVEISGDTLRYEQRMQLDIYGRSFEHLDKSELHRET